MFFGAFWYDLQGFVFNNIAYNIKSNLTGKRLDSDIKQLKAYSHGGLQNSSLGDIDLTLPSKFSKRSRHDDHVLLYSISMRMMNKKRNLD